MVTGTALVAATFVAGAQADTVTTDTPDFEVVSAEVGLGLYQSAYSERNDTLWVTAAIGRPPIRDSELLKIDPETLEVLERYTPPTLGSGADERLEAVYGVAVDDATNTVWVTATRENAVAVYSQANGEHLATIDGVAHSRDVVVDSERGYAYVSEAEFGGGIAKIDTSTYELVETIPLKAETQPMSLELVSDEDTSLLYTTDLASGDVFTIDNLAKSWTSFSTGKSGASASGISVDPERQRAYIANQGTSDVTVVDLATESVIREVAGPEGTLNTAYDTENDLAYATVFWGNTLNVIDGASGENIANLPVGIHPNDVTVADGAAYVTGRAASYGGDGSRDKIWKITVSDGSGEPTDPTDPTDPDKPTVPPATPAGAEVEFTQPVTAGQTLSVSGRGFAPGSQLAVKMDQDSYGMLRGNPGDGTLTQGGGPRIVVGSDGTFTDEPVIIPTKNLAGTPTGKGWHILHFLDSEPLTRVWVPFKVVTSDEPGEPGEPGGTEGNVDVDVQVPGGGGLTLALPGSPRADLGRAELADSIDAFVATGSLPEITVTDVRSSDPGWALVGKVSDFTSGDTSIAGNYLGWSPQVLRTSEGQAVTPGGQVTAGLSSNAALASAGAGAGIGTAIVGAQLDLRLPTTTPAGDYRAVLTLTLS